MRSELVFGAMTYVSNRFLLTRVTAKATRRFHRPNTRLQDTANEIFERFTRANPLAGVACPSTLQLFPRTAQGETRTSPRRCHVAPTTSSVSPRRLIDACSFTSSQLLSASHQSPNPALAPSPKPSAPFNSHRSQAVRAASFKSLYLQRPHNGHQTTFIVPAPQIQPKDL
jgi:hypothetical protein